MVNFDVFARRTAVHTFKHCDKRLNAWEAVGKCSVSFAVAVILNIQKCVFKAHKVKIILESLSGAFIKSSSFLTAILQPDASKAEITGRRCSFSTPLTATLPPVHAAHAI